MLANSLLSVCLLLVITTTFLSAGLAMTRATVSRMAQTYAVNGYERALGVLQQTLANELQQGPLPSPLPSIAPLAAACADSGAACRYKSAATIAFTQTSSPAPTATCDAGQTNCARGEQANAYVDENRVNARITVTVTAADGTALVTRSANVALRTMRVPPYVALTSAKDGAFDALPAGTAAGDDGGSAPATPNPCAADSPGVADDTAVRVAYRNAVSSACSAGNTWRTESYSTSAGAAAGWSP